MSNIQPVVDASTRTLKARLEVANAANQLKPDMWVEVQFQFAAGPRLTVPAEALIGPFSIILFPNHYDPQ